MARSKSETLTRKHERKIKTRTAELDVTRILRDLKASNR